MVVGTGKVVRREGRLEEVIESCETSLEVVANKASELPTTLADIFPIMDGAGGEEDGPPG